MTECLRPWKNRPTTELSEMRGTARPFWAISWGSHATLQCSEADQRELSPETQIENIFLRDRSLTSALFQEELLYNMGNRTKLYKLHQVTEYKRTFHCAQASSLCWCLFFSSMLRPAEEASPCLVNALRNMQKSASCQCWMHTEKSARCRLPKHSKRPWNLATWRSWKKP